MIRLLNRNLKFDSSFILKSGWGSFISASFVLCLIPTFIWYIPPFMILWGIFWVLEKKGIENNYEIKLNNSKWLFILFVAFYLWQVFGILYTEDKKYGLNMIFGRMSLFLFPLVLFIPGIKIKENGKWLLRIFSLSTIFFIIVCFGNALIKSISINEGAIIFNPHPQKEYWMSYFYSYYFSINQHTTYLAMYAILSGFIAFESWFDTSLSKVKRIYWLVTGIALFISLYFISSRSGLLGVIILVPVYLFLKIKNRKKILPLVIVFVVLVVLVFVARTNERVQIGINENSMESFLKKDGRLSIWTSAIHIIKSNMILGVGIGDTKTELLKEYNLIGEKNLISEKYNAHNEYLEIMLENGVIGALIFAGILIFMFFIAISEHNNLLVIFILMMMIFFMFETILNRLQGVAFFSIFSFLLIHVKNKQITFQKL